MHTSAAQSGTHRPRTRSTYIQTSITDNGGEALDINDVFDTFQGNCAGERIREAILALTKRAADASPPKIALSHHEQCVSLVGAMVDV